MLDDLYTSIGGQPTITAVIESFYQRVLEDKALSRFFTSTDMAHLRTGQNMFISMLLGGRMVHTGEGIREAHERARAIGLTDSDFDAFLKHFRASLDEVGVSPERAVKVMKLLEAKRKDVLNL